MTLINTYRNPARLFIAGGGEILSREGTTQGDPLAMPFYAVFKSLLITILRKKFDCIKQVWLADDASAAGNLDHLYAFSIVYKRKVNDLVTLLMQRKHG